MSGFDYASLERRYSAHDAERCLTLEVSIDGHGSASVFAHLAFLLFHKLYIGTLIFYFLFSYSGRQFKNILQKIRVHPTLQ